MKSLLNRKDEQQQNRAAQKDPLDLSGSGGPAHEAVPNIMPPVQGSVLSGSRRKSRGGDGGSQQMTTLPTGLIGRANRVLGMDLSDVTVIIDPQLEAQGKNGAAEDGKIIRLAPRAASDTRVIWHEMTHIVQQRGGNVPGCPASSNRETLEKEAHAGAEARRKDDRIAVGPAATGEPLYDDGVNNEASRSSVEISIDEDDITLESGHNEVDATEAEIGIENKPMKIGVKVQIPVEALKGAELEFEAGKYKSSDYSLNERGDETVVYVSMDPRAPYANLRLKITGLSSEHVSVLRRVGTNSHATGADKDSDATVSSQYGTSTDTDSQTSSTTTQGKGSTGDGDPTAVAAGTLTSGTGTSREALAKQLRSLGRELIKQKDRLIDSEKKGSDYGLLIGQVQKHLAHNGRLSADLDEAADVELLELLAEEVDDHAQEIDDLVERIDRFLNPDPDLESLPEDHAAFIRTINDWEDETKYIGPLAYEKHWRGGSNEDRQKNAKFRGAGQFLAKTDDGSPVSPESVIDWERGVVERALDGDTTVTVDQRNTSTFHLLYEHGFIVGFAAATGEKVRGVRVEWSSGTVHSHPRKL